MANLFSKLWRSAKKPALSAEEQRHADDAAKLAEYKAFDDAVGAAPTQETLQQRFKDAAYKGHTQVIEDTLKKGLEAPAMIRSVWHLPGGGAPHITEDNPIDVAARNEWPDTVGALLGAADDKGLEKALRSAEGKRNIDITRAIRGEMTRRAAPSGSLSPATAADPSIALQAPMKISKPLKI